MTASQLKLYNGALRILGERSLTSLTEDREPRHLLDDVWADGALNHCLEQGLWNFAMRSVEATYSPSITPDFGYSYGYDQPSDYVRLANISTDEYFVAPLIQYADEAGIWYCDQTTIYIRYVSNDSSYGADYSLWPESFNKYVQYYLASQIAERVTQNSGKVEAVLKLTNRALVNARSKDAMNEPTKFPPRGFWARSRLNGFTRRYDRA